VVESSGGSVLPLRFFLFVARASLLSSKCGRFFASFLNALPSSSASYHVPQYLGSSLDFDSIGSSGLLLDVGALMWSS